MNFLLLTILVLASWNAFAGNSLSYSGRLVNADGSPVVGPVNLRFEVSYTNPVTMLCSEDIASVSLTNGVFHVKLDFPNCTGSLTFDKVVKDTPTGESLAIRLIDQSPSGRTYSYQAVHSIPFAKMSDMAKEVVTSMGAADGQTIIWNDAQKKWLPAAYGAGTGSVTSITAGTGLSGGTITSTGTIALANGGVDNAQLANSAVTDSKISASASIDRTKLAAGSASHVLVNTAGGVMSSVAQLPLAQGGTGAANAADARSNLGLSAAATAAIGYAAGNVMPGDGVPICFPGFKLHFTGSGPAFWSCVTDDSTDTTKLPLAGGTMSGAIAMGGSQITGLGAPSLAGDAATKSYVDSTVAGAANAWTAVSGNIYRSSGYVGIATTAPSAPLDVRTAVGGEGQFTLSGYDNNITAAQSSAAAEGQFIVQRSRGTINTPTAVQSNDAIGSLSFRGHNGTAFQDMAQIKVEASTLTTAGAAIGSMDFKTRRFNQSGLNSRMYINNVGNVSIGTQSNAAALVVSASAANNDPVYTIEFTNNKTGFPYPTQLKYTYPSGANVKNIYGSGIYQRIQETFSDSSYSINFNDNSNSPIPGANHTMTNTGLFGFGLSSGPTATIHVKAGTAAASSAPIKLIAGPVMTTPEAGAIEFDGTNLYFTDNSGTPVRKTIATSSGGSFTGVSSVTGSGALTVTAGGTNQNLILSATGTGVVQVTTPMTVTSINAGSDIITAGTFIAPLATATNPSYSFSGDLNTGVYSPGADIWGISTAGTERLRIDAAGNVGIGTVAPTAKLDVNGAINIGTGFTLKVAGTDICSASGCTSSSDKNLKKNIKPLDNSLEKITQLQGVSYDWKNKKKFGDKHQIGLIAQDLEKVYPEVVVTNPQSGLKSVAYDHLVAPLIEAFKSLVQKMNAQEKKADKQARSIASLEQENVQLQNKVEHLEQEQQMMKQYLCSKDSKASFCVKRK